MKKNESVVGDGYTPYFVEGDDPDSMHQTVAQTLDAAITEIRQIQASARASGKAELPSWPMIVLRTPKGWTGPKEINGHKAEGSWRSHQVPFSDVRTNPTHLKLLEDWLRSYKPEELFDFDGRLVPELREHLPELKVRFVNVVDLYKLQPASKHPHGSTEREFDGLFTTDRPVIFDFHGYPWLIHKLAYRFQNHEPLHVRGYKERGNINTPLGLHTSRSR